MRAKQEPLYQALRFLNDPIPKSNTARLQAVRDFTNKHCSHDLRYDGICCDCGLVVDTGESSI